MSESVALDGNTPVTMHNPRARRLRSLVWNDFTKERRADGSYVAICNHCKRQLTASSRSGTTHLKNHLATCLSTKRVRRKKLIVRRLQLKQVDMDGTVPVVVGHSFNQESSQQYLARMIMQHGYRFSIVDDIGFQRFVKNLQPQFRMVSYENVEEDCMNLYEAARIRLHEALRKLPSRLTLSVDMWRSSVGAEYLCLTCHFIEQVGDEWRLKKKIINFVHVESPLTGEPLTGEGITRTIFEKLCEWGIEKKLVSVVLDNCSSSDFVGFELLRSLQAKGFLLLNGELFHVRSCVHMLNLIFLECLELAQELINRVRASLHFVKSSQDRYTRFQEVARQAGISEKPLGFDSPNNWASVYAMLESVCHYQEAFVRLAEWDAGFPSFLSSKDWAIVKALTECLDVLSHTMGKLPAAEKSTANLYFNEICGIHILLKTWCNSPYALVASMASQMLQKFEQHWELSKTVMAFASILDPRYKMKSIEYFFKLIYTDSYEAKARIDSIHNSFISLYNDYVVQLANSTKHEPVCFSGNGGGSSNADYGNGAESKTFSRSTLSDTRRGLDQYLEETSSHQTIKSDLDLYFEEAVYRQKEGPTEYFDILAWWKSFAAKYPVLSLMARDILGIPVAIVPLNSEARTLNEHLSTLKSRTVQGLKCAQDWLRDEDEVRPADDLALVPVSAGMDFNANETMMPADCDE